MFQPDPCPGVGILNLRPSDPKKKKSTEKRERSAQHFKFFESFPRFFLIFEIFWENVDVIHKISNFSEILLEIFFIMGKIFENFLLFFLKFLSNFIISVS